MSVQSSNQLGGLAGVAGGFAPLDSGLLVPRAYLPQIAGLLHNMNASAAPTVNDDSGDGYGVGSRWLDTTADREYVCLDATAGAAVWNLTTGQYLSRRVLANAANALTTFNVNSASYQVIAGLEFYHDWDALPATHFLITCYAQASEAAQTIKLQLAAAASPGTPYSSGGDDVTITNSAGNFSSGWKAVASAHTGLILMCLGVKGSNGTVDLAHYFLDIAFKVA